MRAIIAGLLLLAFPLGGKSQVSSENDTVPFLIPALETLIKSALEHSPVLKSQMKNSEMMDHEMKIQRKKWMDYIFLEGSTSYGLNDQVLINSNTQSNTASGLIVRGEQARYFGGVGVKIPVTSFLSRSNEIEIRKITKERSELEYLQLADALKQLVIDEYYNLIYLEESMRTFQIINQTLEISHLKAEKDLLNGRMDINAFGLLTSTVGKSKDDYMKARNNFYAQYYKLQVLTGMEFKK